jgi:hypothetical protein
MYLEKQDTDYSLLKQGDILEGIQILGAINLGSINIVTNFKGEQVSWAASVKPTFSHAIILSHSCEIDPSNKVKMTSIILAPLRDVNNASPEEKIKDLISSNFIDEKSDHSYLKYFYLVAHESLPYTNGAIADLAKCFSVRKNSYDILLSHKVLQMKPEVIGHLSFKTALYFHRD